jgi:monomeric sarcosine oxidase
LAGKKTFDVAVLGAGVFGAWTAHHLRRWGKEVVLVDAYGPANSRASSGGESRIIRMGYGADEVYTRWAMRALELWQEFFMRVAQPLFVPTGFLWLVPEGSCQDENTEACFRKLGVKFEKLSREELERRYPQVNFGAIAWGMLEISSGVLLARRAVHAVVQAAMKNGVEYASLAVASPSGRGRLESVRASRGDAIYAGTFVFACGPWLGKLFPELLRDRVFPTRQEVYFFGVPPGDRRFAPPALPAWYDRREEFYGVPVIEERGFKVACDGHGPAFDPDTGNRVVTAEGLEAARAFLARRFSALKAAPVVETRVCQYENTSNGDFLVDRHPDFENVWLVGGGSGHGFKHGPMLGEYVAERIVEGGTLEPRFTLATKEKIQKREVF